MTSPLRARTATASDAAAIADIYNQGIEDRCATFETQPRSAADVLAWFDGRHPIVAGSRALLRAAGFREVGVYEQQAQLEGGWKDVVLLEKLIF